MELRNTHNPVKKKLFMCDVVLFEYLPTYIQSFRVAKIK